MGNEKIVKYDIDGYEKVTTALTELLNQYPALERGEEITFSVLEETSGIGMFPVSGAVVETEKRSITGKVTKVCLYPFYVVYRASGQGEKGKERIKEWLDTLGKWLEQQKVVIDGEEYVLSELPPLTDGRKFLSIERQTPAYLDNTNEDKAEDWAIYISARYQYEYQK